METIISVIPIGFNFTAGKSRIGRERLPAGLMAHLDGGESLRLAIHALHAYAMQPAPIKTRYAIVFRVIDQNECDAINHKLKNIFGPQEFASRAEDFCPPLGRWHLLDSEHIQHLCNRHSDHAVEVERGHLPIGVADIARIPEIIHSKNIREFSKKGDMPRIVYAREIEGSQLVAVEEISRKRGLVVKTLYKQKK